jgi:hypothetical protein
MKDDDIYFEFDKDEIKPIKISFEDDVRIETDNENNNYSIVRKVHLNNKEHLMNYIYTLIESGLDINISTKDGKLHINIK